MDNKKIENFMEKGYNCSQTVFAYFADDLGLDEEIAVKISTPFEMGMYKSDICGALTASYMALGLKYGSTDPYEKIELSKMIYKLDKEFEERMGHTKCANLLKVNVNTDDGFNYAVENDLLSKVCGKCITNAIEITEEIMDEKDEKSNN